MILLLISSSGFVTIGNKIILFNIVTWVHISLLRNKKCPKVSGLIENNQMKSRFDEKILPGSMTKMTENFVHSVKNCIPITTLY